MLDLRLTELAKVNRRKATAACPTSLAGEARFKALAAGSCLALANALPYLALGAQLACGVIVRNDKRSTGVGSKEAWVAQTGVTARPNLKPFSRP